MQHARLHIAAPPGTPAADRPVAMGMAPPMWLCGCGASLAPVHTSADYLRLCRAGRRDCNAQARAHKSRPAATRANPASASTGLQPPSAQRNPNGERTADAMYVCTSPLGEVTPINIPVQFAVALPANGTN